MSPVVERILEAAQGLIAAGNPAFTMEALAAAAEVGRSTLYRHFANRAAVIAQIEARYGSDGDRLNPASIRDRILIAARDVFGRHGFAGGTIEEIARGADVGQATVYRHFGDKEGIFKALVASFEPRRKAARLLDPQADPREALAGLGEELLGFIHENRQLLRLGLMGDEATREMLTRVREAPNRTRFQLERYFARLVQDRVFRGMDPGMLAGAYSSLMMGFALLEPISEGHRLEDPRGVARFIADLMVDGARRRRE